jgi:glycolate oxidase iron-sulfur subunit
MTTCPSGVHYMHLVDHARVHIEATYTRPLAERLLRMLLLWVLPHNSRFRLALRAAQIARPLAPLLSSLGLTRLAAMLKLAPAKLPGRSSGQAGTVFPAVGTRRGRVALLRGCVTPVIGPSVEEAAIRVLSRHGVEVVMTEGQVCCGGIAHHAGHKPAALVAVRANVDAWIGQIEAEGLDAILVTASGCGTTLKDYGFMLRTDAAYAEKAARVSRLAMDISEYLARLKLSPKRASSSLVVAYHAACSLQHGQKILRQPKELLSKLGFVVKDVPEGHLCCGSAGTYNILQPALADKLRARKVGNIEKVNPDVIAAGNVGCVTQIAAGTTIPVVHTVELIDWATGGPQPERLKELKEEKGIPAAAEPVAAAM